MCDWCTNREMNLLYYSRIGNHWMIATDELDNPIYYCPNCGEKLNEDGTFKDE